MKRKEDNLVIFQRNEKNLLPLAKEKESSGDFEGALSLYLEIEKNAKFNLSLYRMIANCYTALQMYKESVNYWFKYLNFVSPRHYAEAYNGLGGNFYLLGEIEVSAYYFNMQISNEEDDEYPFDEYIYEIFANISEEKPTIKLVDLQGDTDKQNIEKAKQAFEKDPALAYSLVKNVQESSSQYENACITLAAFYMIDGDYEKAISKYKEIESSSEQYKFAVNNLYGAYYCMKDFESANKIFAKLSNEKLADFDQLVKFFHLLFTQKDYDLCYKFNLSLNNLFKTPRLYFYNGVSAYNVKKYDEAFDWFVSYYKATSYYVANFNSSVSLAKLKGEKGCPEILRYSLTLPSAEQEKLEKNATKYFGWTKKQLKKNKDLIFDFAYKSFSTDNHELQIVACQLLSFIGGAKVEKYLKSLLIDFTVLDHMKVVIVTVLTEMQNDKLTGMVYGKVYSRLPFEKAEFSEDDSGLFLSAYALAFGRMSPYDEEELYKLHISAYELYFSLLSNGNLRKVNDVIALGAFIVLNAEIEIDLSPEQIIEYVGSTVKNVNKIIKLVTSE